MFGECWAGVLAAVLAFPVVFVLIYMFRTPLAHRGTRRVKVKPPIKDVLAHSESAPYDVKNMNAIRASGKLFQFLIWLCYTRLGKMVLVPHLLRDSGLDILSYLFLPEAPTYRPSPPRPEARDYSEPNQQIIQQLIERPSPSDSSFRFATVADYVQAFRSGTCTPTDVATAVVEAIKQSNNSNPPLRGIVDSDQQVVLAMARASTERWKQGKSLSILDGVPVAVKGEHRVEPYPFRGGSLFIPEATKGVPEGGIVQRLKNAGAVIIGVANMQEFGAGTLGSNPNSYHKHARNPYNPHCFAGGSSSGSAVCVAAGMCPIAVGCDGGGSIRIPAALCGVVGLKPTNHLLDETGILPLAFTVSSSGPLCASVLDCAIAMDVFSQDAEGEEKRVSLEGLGEGRLEGMKVGVYWKFFEHADEEVVEKCKEAVKHLEELGAVVEEVTIPELEESRVAHTVSITSEMGCSVIADVDNHFHDLNLETLLLLSAGYEFSAVNYVNAQKQRTRAIEILNHIYEKVDVIVTPATGRPAPNILPAAVPKGICDVTNSGLLMRFTFLANLTGVPGLVLPVGYTSNGLPISLQLMGRWYEEHVLLRAGWALESSGAFPVKKPLVHYDLLDQARQQGSTE